jgi:hypothetical protein
MTLELTSKSWKSPPIQSPRAWRSPVRHAPVRQSQVEESQAWESQAWESQAWPSPACQSQAWLSLRGEWDAALFWFLGALLAGAAGLFFVLFALCQPTVNPNPGVAAYMPPPGTRLVPLPRVSDAPELAELPVDPPSPLTALAKAQPSDQPAKPDIRPPARKRAGVEQSTHEQRGFGYAPQWNFGPRGSNNNHVWSGGPKSWF